MRLRHCTALAALWILGAASTPAAEPPPVATFDTGLALQGYRLRSGDQIRVDVIDFPDLSKDQLVLPDGTINMVYLGAVRAVGKSPEQLSEELAGRYRGIILRPVISVSVLRTRPLRINVVGEVQKPGPQSFTPQGAVLGNNPSASLGVETVTGALALAGGVTANADVRKISLVRQSADGPLEKQIDLWSALKSGDFSQDYSLVDGDTIKVPLVQESDPNAVQMTEELQASTIAPQQLQVQVMGEVKQPGTVNVPGRNNSVLNAIGLAGGPNNEADLRNIVVARVARSGKMERIPIDLNEIADGRKRVTMRNGDVILVGRKGTLQFGDDARSVLGPFGDILRTILFPFRLFF
jgi:polysaccharide export outer membrane protein